MKKACLLLAVGLFLAAAITIPERLDAASKTIAVMWKGKSKMTNQVMMGFMAKVRTLAPDLQIKQYRHLKDMKELEQVFRESEKNTDGIVVLRSSGAKFLGTANPKLPCFVGGCNNPAELGVIKNLDAPEGNITGVTYFIPYEKRFQIIMSLFPSIKSVGILVQKGHPSGPIEAQGAQAQCKRLGIAYNEVMADDLKSLIEGTKKLAGKVDLIIISNNRLVMDNITNLLPILNKTKTPTFSFADAPVKAGAVAGVAADDTQLGGFLAESVVDVVIKEETDLTGPCQDRPESQDKH